MAEHDADMDTQGVEEEGAPARRLPNVFNLFSGCIVVLVLAICVWASAVFVFPRGPHNPFPPPTASLTPSPTSTPTPTPTRTTAPTRTPTTGPTTTPLPPIFTAEVVVTAQTISDRVCSDRSIAGTVVDKAGSPLTGYTIGVKGDDGFEDLTTSGINTDYGPAGWEILLINYEGTPQPLGVGYTVRLFNPDQVEMASTGPEAIVLTGGCDRNLVLVTFRQVQ